MRFTGRPATVPEVCTRPSLIVWRFGPHVFARRDRTCRHRYRSLGKRSRYRTIRSGLRHLHEGGGANVVVAARADPEHPTYVNCVDDARKLVSFGGEKWTL
jgi:hypothetical protein